MSHPTALSRAARRRPRLPVAAFPGRVRPAYAAAAASAGPRTVALCRRGSRARRPRRPRSRSHRGGGDDRIPVLTVCPRP